MEDPTASPSTVFLAQPTNVIDDIAVNVVLTHGHLADVDLLLVGPEDKAVMLLSDVGCGVSVDGLGLRFEQDVPSLPAGGPIPSGIYAPTNLDQDCGESSDTFPAPAPGSWGTTLDIFRGTRAFGAFRLYVVDDTAGVTGEVERWSLSVRTSAMVPPALDELDDLTVEVGEFFSLPLGLEGNPEPTVTIDGDLPEGVTLTDGVLEGTPTETGNFPLTITASNGFGEITRSFVLSVLETASITSAASATAAVGTPFTHTFAARGFPTPELTVTADDLPEGLSLADGVLSGTPAQTGTFTVSVAAENEHSRDTQTFELTVRDAPAAPSIALETGQSEYTRDATVQLAVVFAEEPAGLSISDFELSGTATRGAASLSGSGLRYTVTVELASDGTVSLALPDGAWQNAEGHLGLGATSTTVTLDRVAPGLGALETLVVQLPEGASTITVDYPLPTVTDSSPTDLTCEPAPGTPLAEGVHPIECSATDAAGNTTVATAHILVLPAGDGTVGGVGDSIDVPDNAVASPYPAIISIDAPGRVVTDVDVYLRIRHSFAADLDILLEAPDGRAVMLMSDVGCDSSGTWDLRIDQHAEQHLPAGSPLASGRYKPTNLDPDGCGTG